MLIDITFNFYSDSNGGDPDLKSPTLRRYHKFIWSRQLPNGEFFTLNSKPASNYLSYHSESVSFSLGSDAIVHSYKNQKRKQWLIRQMDISEVNELKDLGSTIGGYVLFPNKKIDNKYSINQARGVIKQIDDRFDLTLECIRLYYLGESSPLYETFLRYKHFFDLFVNFNGYCKFFLLQDILDESGNIKFYLPFDGFSKPPNFGGVEDYMNYKKNVMNFIIARNERMRELSIE